MLNWIMQVVRWARRFGLPIFILTFLVVSFWLLAQNPPKPTSVRFAHADKVAHFIVFFALAVSLHLAFRPRVWLGVVLLLSYGIAIEVIQYFVPNRGAEVLDVVADLCGVLAFYVLLGLVKRLGWLTK